MKSGWKKYLLYSVFVIVAVGSFIGLLKLVLLGYSQDWTGFGEYTSTSPNTERGKTFWDWMNLLIIPLVLVLGAFFLNRSDRAIERERAERRAKLEDKNAKDRKQEAALQTYLGQMTELLLEKDLRNSENDEIHNVARIWTITTLRGLDPERKGLVITFLQEANLINKEKTVISLSNADLSGADFELIHLEGVNLKNANLVFAKLRHAHLEGANLEDAQLLGAHLEGANLEGASLKDANLLGANLKEARLEGSHLEGAYLEGAHLEDAYVPRAFLQSVDLQDAHLEGAFLLDSNLQNANLEGTKLKGATMPDGTVHE